MAHTEVFVRSERFKFSAAHFVAFHGYRERLHGHNYTVAVRLIGPTSETDGYVIDFGEVKQVVRAICAELNERFLCPVNSDAMQVGDDGHNNVTLRCEDGAIFSLPRDDCAMLPIVHSTAEELAALLWHRIVDAFGIDRLDARGITILEVAVAEAPSQEARYTRAIRSTATPDLKSPLTSSCQAFAVIQPTNPVER